MHEQLANHHQKKHLDTQPNLKTFKLDDSYVNLPHTMLESENTALQPQEEFNCKNCIARSKNKRLTDASQFIVLLAQCDLIRFNKHSKPLLADTKSLLL
jgi:hypothetical protein